MDRYARYRRTHKESISKRRRASYAANRDEELALAKTYRARGGVRTLMIYAKSRAKRNGVEFNLPEDWKAEVTTCELCGLPFVYNDPMYAASIDRIDNALGYTPDNCRLILRGLNVFKNKHADETMMTVARALVETQSRR